ncbi:MAG: hypothetical protein QXK89_04335 [Candidatus Bathyarchaeia archaeon]
MPEEIWLYLTLILGITAVASIVLFLTERERRKTSQKSKEPVSKVDLVEKPLPVTVTKTVPDDVVKEARDKLRVLDLEREILSYAIRRLYEAHAEGKITLEERDSLALKYREDLERIKQEIARGESIIALSELERMQEEFIKMFSERFETLNRRIEELRAIAGLMPPERIVGPREERREEERIEASSATITEQVEKPATPKRRRETVKPKAVTEKVEAGVEGEREEKSEADKKLEQIMAEVEKVLSKLSQMEVEG